MGARLLIKATPTTYDIGDPVVAMPMGHVWGASEGYPHFLQLDIPDMDLSEALVLCQPEYAEGYNVLSGELEQTLMKKRQVYLKQAAVKAGREEEFTYCYENSSPYNATRDDLIYLAAELK